MTTFAPLPFDPIFKPALWGGRKLKPFFGLPATEEAIGEAWILSDQGDNASVVTDGPWQGKTLRELLESHPHELIGSSKLPGGRFPILLKLIDAADKLSVQVHPTDDLSTRFPAPDGKPHPGLGKTEAWVILEAAKDSEIYAGVKPGTTAESIRDDLKKGSITNWLHEFHPKRGDCLFLEAGTVHAIGKKIFLFEIQQTSDITYRLFDWNRVDAKTGKPRDLHIEPSLACIDYARGPVAPVVPKLELEQEGTCERLVSCRYFELWRWSMQQEFAVGAPGKCRVVVCTGGAGTLLSSSQQFELKPGSVYLLPAELGGVWCIPAGTIELMECGIP
ncbi:class I mannose-6-phosphate isomerase [Telmatocola sphagniphila]|uniref:Class I mannose-6-phosphate isomerase n=1 Tax=Telmatocola sphagniphila TaxID=1123043 RepID=A0A8E6B126_9BACT|nr:type I phosphomannose isomerase catalytic subunit [Telmatocola sphagniphila]QVL29955.1 class I mannose-6-phosphate isomerase [Telmatocola sphagniphila]